MARSIRSTTCFFRHEGAERRDVFLRIKPTALRFSQAKKGATVDTLGGYFREVLRSADPERNGLLLPELTIEATTGVAYRAELRTIQWIWRNSSAVDPKTNKPADVYFFDTTQTPDYSGVKRSGQYGFLIDIQNFAFDDSVNKRNEIPFTLRCKVLKDLFFKVEAPVDVKPQPLPVRKAA